MPMQKLKFVFVSGGKIRKTAVNWKRKMRAFAHAREELCAMGTKQVLR